MAKHEIDPELSVRVQALSEQSRSLGKSWDQEQAQTLFDEADTLAHRAQSANLDDLSEVLLGLAAYLSSLADSAMRPNDTQRAQLQALADSAADSLQRYRAQIDVAVLAPGATALPPQPAIHYLGRNTAFKDLLRTRFAQLGYGVTSC